MSLQEITEAVNKDTGLSGQKLTSVVLAVGLMMAIKVKDKSAARHFAKRLVDATGCVSVAQDCIEVATKFMAR